MTEFTRTKMHFALALLGTLFAIHPFVEKLEHAGFDYLGYRLEVFHAYGLTAGLLAVAIYCYAVALLSEKPSSRTERAGNYCYAVAVLIFPLYGGLFLSHLLAQWVVQSRLLEQWLSPEQLGWAGPITAAALGIIWLGASQVLAWRLRYRLGNQDVSAKVEQLAEQEMKALDRASEMFRGQHYDLSVIEAWKALEARLRRVLLLRGLNGTQDDPQAMIVAAGQAGIIHGPALALVHDLRRQWNVAVGTEPLTRESAEKAQQAARDILATIAVTNSAAETKHTV